MALQSHSNSSDELASASPDCSSEATPTEVYSSPLGINGGISGLYLSNEELNPINLLGDAVADRAPRNIILNSEGTRIGDDVYVTVQGPANFTVNHVGPGCQPLENGAPKDVPASRLLPERKLQKPSGGLDLIKHHYKALTILIAIMILVCAATLISFKFLKTSDSKWSTPEEPVNTTKGPPVHYFIKKSSWGGRWPTKPLVPIETPVSLVIIKHTKTGSCHDILSCFTAMQNLQNTDVGEHGLAEVRYNFVVGGDGNVYEGRGWSSKNEQMNNTIDIAFLGDFNVEVPSGFVAETGPWLISEGIKKGYLDPIVLKVVCHNQTEDTDSPATCPLRQDEDSGRFNQGPAVAMSRRIRIFMTCFVPFVLVLLAIILWVVLGNKHHQPVTEAPSTTTADPTTTETPDLGWFIPRETWGGVAPKSDPIRIKPALLAVVKHTGGSTCSTYKACRARVREIQKEHIEIQMLPDISYNFLIGGDGKIYIGRGFGVLNGGRNDSLDMAFIGNFTENIPTGPMLSLGRRILIQGPREQGLNYSKYYLVNHNQTEPTDSPGEELFKAVAGGYPGYNHYSNAVCYKKSSEGFVIDYNCPWSDFFIVNNYD